MAKIETSTSNTSEVITVDADAVRAEGSQAERDRFNALDSAFTDKAFVSEMFKTGKSVGDAQPLWLAKEIERLSADNKRLTEEIDQAKKAPASKDAKPASGAEAVTFSGDESADGDFMALSKALAAEKKLPLHKAMSKIARERPELHAAFVADARK